jgi:hypothetical protein
MLFPGDTPIRMFLGVIVGILYKEPDLLSLNQRVYFLADPCIAPLTGTSTTICLGPGGVYMSGTVGDPCGIITIPAITGLCRFTQRTLFRPRRCKVQDSGVREILFGVTLGTLGVLSPLRAWLGAKAERTSNRQKSRRIHGRVMSSVRAR